MPLAWVTERLSMGTRGHLAWLLQRRGKSRLAVTTDQSLLGVTQRIISWGQSRDGGELARGNRFVDTEGFCKSQVTLNGLYR